MVKNPPANAGDMRNLGLSSGLGKSPGGGHGHPLQWNIPWTGAWLATVHRVTKNGTRWGRMRTHFLRVLVGTTGLPVVRFDQRGGRDGRGGKAFSRGGCMREARREEGLHLVSGSGCSEGCMWKLTNVTLGRIITQNDRKRLGLGLGGPSQPGSRGFSGRVLPCLSNFTQLLAKVRLLFSAAFAERIFVAAVMMLNSFQLFFVYVAPSGHLILRI